MTEHKPLTDFQKGEIIALKPLYSIRKIGRQLNIPHETISDFICHTNNRKSVGNLPHPGRPRKTSKRTDRYLVRLAKANTRVPLKEL